MTKIENLIHLRSHPSPLALPKPLQGSFTGSLTNNKLTVVFADRLLQRLLHQFRSKFCHHHQPNQLLHPSELLLQLQRKLLCLLLLQQSLIQLQPQVYNKVATNHLHKASSLVHLDLGLAHDPLPDHVPDLLPDRVINAGLASIAPGRLMDPPDLPADPGLIQVHGPARGHLRPLPTQRKAILQSHHRAGVLAEVEVQAQLRVHVLLVVKTEMKEAGAAVQVPVGAAAEV
jgi:hypothetical protein